MLSFVRLALVMMSLGSNQTITKTKGICGVVNISNQLMLDKFIFSYQSGPHYISSKT